MNFKKLFHFNTYLPRGLTGRTVLLIIVPAIILQAISAFLFFDRHWKNVNNNLIDIFMNDLDVVLYMLGKSNTPEDIKKAADFSEAYLKMNVKVYENTIFRKKKNKYPYIAINNAGDLEKRLSQKFNGDYNIYTSSNPAKVFFEIPFKRNLVVISTHQKRVFTSSVGIFFVWSVVGVFISVLIIIPFLKSQMDSIKKLVRAADAFGKGNEVNFKPSGATQIRRAGVAFLAMKNRIQKFVENRTNMLSGVSHDLRTPLTRMRLELELLDLKSDNDEALKNQILENISDMEKMISSYIDYAKGVYVEDKSDADINFMLNNVIKNIKKDNKINKNNVNIQYNSELKNKDSYIFNVPEHSMKRIFSNIILNAVRYGKGEIYVSLIANKSGFKFIVEDNGKGIDEKYYEDIFKPFFRVEGSRNNKTGGTGLGLAIVKDLVLTNGGDVVLGKSEKLGGLKVIVDIPA